MRAVAEYMTSQGVKMDIPAIIASLAGLATLIGFMVKSYYRVPNGSQAIRTRGGRIVRDPKTVPVIMKDRRKFFWFGPILRDEQGRPLQRVKRYLWRKAQLHPPRDATLEEQLDPMYGDILIYGPRVYFAMILYGAILMLNTQDNPDSVITTRVDIPASEQADEIQRDIEVGLLWGVTHSRSIPGVIPPIAKAVSYGSNGLPGLVQQRCLDAVRMIYEDPAYSSKQLGDAEFVYQEVNDRVSELLEKYGIDLRAVSINGRAKSVGQMVKESGNSGNNKILSLLELIAKKAA